MAPTEPTLPDNAKGLAEIGRDRDQTVVVLRGEHDASTSADLAEILDRAIAMDDADLVVDLSQVRFMDASTIGVIIGVRNVLRASERSLSLRDPATCARLVLDACGLDEMVGSDSPRSGAAAALGSWVEVPSLDRADRGDDEATPAAATPAQPKGNEEEAGSATVPASRRGP